MSEKESRKILSQQDLEALLNEGLTTAIHKAVHGSETSDLQNLMKSMPADQWELVVGEVAEGITGMGQWDVVLQEKPEKK